MPRIRTIKPEFFKHEDLFDAERASGLPLRLAFISLWTVADRDGRFKWRPRALKVECLPYDECDFALVLDALCTRGFIVKYACGMEVFGCIPSFGKHQVINNRESKSELPDPNKCNGLTREPRVDDAISTPLVQEQGEGKGREGKTVAIATGAVAPIPAPDYPTEPRERLWAEGVDCLKACGATDRDARSNIGRWLKANDPGHILDAIRRARDHATKDPVALVSRILSPITGKDNGPGRPRTVQDSARDMQTAVRSGGFDIGDRPPPMLIPGRG